MTLSTAYSNLTLKSFAKTLEVNLPLIEVIGKLGKNQFETVIKLGDELDFIMPPEVSVSLYDGTSTTHQKLKGNTVKIKCNTPLKYDMGIDDTETAFINAMPEEKGAPYLANSVKNATEKFITKRELAMVALAPLAGFNLNASKTYNSSGYTTPTNPIALTANNIKQFFHNAKAQMFDGNVIDGVPRSSWVDGKMLMFIPAAVESLLVGTGDLKYTETGLKSQIKGYVGDYAGFKIITTNMIAPDANGNYQLIYGVEGEALGTIMTKNLTSEKLRAQDFIGDIFRGLGIFGVGVVRRDKLGTAYVSVAL